MRFYVSAAAVEAAGRFLACSSCAQTCLCVFQGSAVIDSVTGASKEEGSGSFPPPAEDTPSQAGTLEPDRSDRGERPPSSEYGTLLR